MRKIHLIPLFLGVMTLVTACGDLTFENPGQVDFQRFRSVLVLPITVEGVYQFDSFGSNDDAYDYLVDELRSSSGFQDVITHQLTRTDADLSVWLSTSEQYDYETDEITYFVSTSFLLVDSSGREVISGTSVSSDSNLSDAVNETLREVSHAFLEPYRI